MTAAFRSQIGRRKKEERNNSDLNRIDRKEERQSLTLGDQSGGGAYLGPTAGSTTGHRREEAQQSRRFAGTPQYPNGQVGPALLCASSAPGLRHSAARRMRAHARASTHAAEGGPRRHRASASGELPWPPSLLARIEKWRKEETPEFLGEKKLVGRCRWSDLASRR